MSLSLDLLDQAEHLALWDKSKPRQANLRRAISSAYYALFHMLVDGASIRFSPRRPALLSSQIGRTLNHGEMKEACKSTANSTSDAGKVLLKLNPAGFSLELRTIARTFIALQEARHEADYDIEHDLTRSSTLKRVGEAKQAFENWVGIKNSDEVTVFLAALLFGKRWNR